MSYIHSIVFSICSIAILSQNNNNIYLTRGNNSIYNYQNSSVKDNTTIFRIALTNLDQRDQSYQRKYTVTFDPNGGTVGETSRNVNKGNALGELPTPQKEGDYLFVGWYTNKSYTTKISASTKPEDDATYYARWVDRMSTVYSQEGSVTFFGNSNQGYTVDGVENTNRDRYINI